MNLNPNCVFCVKADVNDVDGWDMSMEYGVVNFVPLGPVTDGHRLFVPQRHVETQDVFAGRAVGAAVNAAHEFARLNGIKSFNIIQSNGAPATQTVPHLHVHLVPRRKDDGLALPWSAR